MSENKEIHYYSEIAEKLNNNLILCNNIPEIDGCIYENMVYGDYWEENFKEQEERGEDVEFPDIYQYFLLDCQEYQIKSLQEHYPELIYSYSEVLDLFVLCVPHCGTGWDFVKTEYRE